MTSFKHLSTSQKWYEGSVSRAYQRWYDESGINVVTVTPIINVDINNVGQFQRWYQRRYHQRWSISTLMCLVRGWFRGKLDVWKIRRLIFFRARCYITSYILSDIDVLWRIIFVALLQLLLLLRQLPKTNQTIHLHLSVFVLLFSMRISINVVLSWRMAHHVIWPPISVAQRCYQHTIHQSGTRIAS